MDPQAVQLGYYLRVLWKGKWLILLASVAAFAAMVVYDQRATPPSSTYEASATFLITQAQSGGSRSLTTNRTDLFSPTQETINTQLKLVTSRSVMERAAKKLQAPGKSPTPAEQAMRAQELRAAVSASVVSKTNLIRITASAGSPEVAERRANAVAEAYIDYVNAERSRAIQEAIDRITSELQGVKSPVDVSQQATAALPRLGAELASLRREVEANTQGLQLLQNQTNAGAVNAVRLELPGMEKSARVLDSISRELTKMSAALKGSQRLGLSDTAKSLTAEGTKIEQTGLNLQVISQEIQAARNRVNKLDSFETSAQKAEQVANLLTQLLPQTTAIQIGSQDNSRKLSAIGGYANSIATELMAAAATLRQASTSGVGLTDAQRTTLKSQVTGYGVGLKGASDDLKGLRQNESDFTVYAQLLLIEGQLGSALGELPGYSRELDNLSALATLRNTLSKTQEAIEQARVSLRDAARVLIAQDSVAAGEINVEAVGLARSDVARVMLVLNVSSKELRTQAATIQDPYMKAQINQVADALGPIAPGGDANLVDQLTNIQGRVQNSGDQLWVTWQRADSQVRAVDLVEAATASATAHSEATEIAISLDVAFRQLTDLKGNRNLDPLVSGQLDALADRLSVTNKNMEGVVDRLEAAVNNFTREPPRQLVEGQQRLEVAAESLGRAATLNASLATDKTPGVFRGAMIQMNDQTDAARAILTWVADSLVTLKDTETDPIRFGQLSVLVDRIRASQARTAQVSQELQLLQNAGGPGYIELIKLQQDLELSLLVPQDTGISIVDSAAALPPGASKNAIFYKIRIPLGAVAGLLAGSLFVLARDQSDTSVRTLGKLRAQVAAAPLGVVPRKKVRRNGEPPMFSDGEASDLSDAMQLLAAGLGGPLNAGARSLLITSAAAKEGKTMLAVNLAHALARRGRRVLLVDGNLRSPGVAKALRLSEEDGLAAALAQGRNPLDLVQTKDNFKVLPVGQPPVNPIELVFSDAMANFLNQAKVHYDVVLVDGPSVLGNAEIKALAKNVDKAVLVVRSGATSGDLLKQAQEELQGSGAGLAGTVLNFANDDECGHLEQRKGAARPQPKTGPQNQQQDWVGRKVIKPQTLFSRLLGQ